MNRSQKNAALACGVGAALLSLPLPWATIELSRVLPEGLGNFGFSPTGGMSVDDTGFSGHVTLLVKVPLWLAIASAAAAGILQLLDARPDFEAPRWVPWTLAALAALWIGWAFVATVSSDQASLGIGALFGLAAAGLPLACLIWPAATEASEEI